MGCDIHLYVEAINCGDSWEMMMHEDMTECGRNYELFAILAGVRNRFNITPISEPKGLPKDVNPIVGHYISQYADHSFSWLTLKEIRSYKWDEDRNMSGLVSPGDLEKWKATKSLRPDSWCQGTSRDDYTLCLIPYNTKEWCCEFLEFVDFVEKKLEYTDPEKIRFVFGFDN